MRLLLGAMVAAFLVACGADDGSSSLIRLTDEAQGENCAAGGQRVDVGLDDGDPGGIANDGTLQDDEVDQTSYVCAADPGAGEEEPSFATLVAVSDEPAGANCEAGGQRLDVGVDDGDGGGTADDGVLDAGEIDSSYYLCRDPAATDTDQLVVVSAEGGGMNCIIGGQRIDVGLDDGEGEGATAGDGVLDEGEIDETRYVCRRAGVGKYELLPFTFNQEQAKERCDDAGLVLASWGDESDLDDLIAVCDLGPRLGGTAPFAVCYTRFVAADAPPNNEPVSLYNGNAMPEVPLSYWRGEDPVPYLANVPIVIRQDLLAFINTTAVGYPVCNIPRSIPGENI